MTQKTDEKILSIIDARETPLKSFIKDTFMVSCFIFLGWINHQFLGGGWVYQALIVFVVLMVVSKHSRAVKRRICKAKTKKEAIDEVNKFFS